MVKGELNEHILIADTITTIVIACIVVLFEGLVDMGLGLVSLIIGVSPLRGVLVSIVYNTCSVLMVVFFNPI